MNDMPLFERLTRPKGDLTGTRHIRSLEQLKVSVVEEIRRIVSTRNYFSTTSHDADILSFGIPNPTNFNAKNSEDWESIRRSIERAVMNFEPRIHNVNVGLDSSDSSIFIRGDIVWREQTEAIRFSIID